jgi:hypothetical protein
VFIRCHLLPQSQLESSSHTFLEFSDTLLGGTAQQEAGVESMKAFGVISLDNSLRPLKEHFNNNKSRLRFWALLSPT